jgi:hypothetical protein
MEKPAIQAREYAWFERRRLSPLLAEIVRDIIEHPEEYEESAAMPSLDIQISIYILRSEWKAAALSAESVGQTIGSAIRTGLVKKLADVGILWDEYSDQDQDVA